MKISSDLVKKFQKKWNVLNALEREETRHMSFQDRFRESASLMRLGKALHVDFKEDREQHAVRLRWARLKKKYS